MILAGKYLIDEKVKKYISHKQQQSAVKSTAFLNKNHFAAIIESIAPNGYSGATKLLVAADFHGKVLGVRITEHHETPGLGDKINIRISNWINYFSGKKLTQDIVPIGR